MLRFDRIVAWDRPSSIALGMFDGGHIGHQEVIRRAVAAGKLLNATPAVFSFSEHPTRVLDPEHPKPLLTSVAEKVQILEGLGVELAWLVDFTPELSQMPARVFIEEVLVPRLRACYVSVGDNFHFGHDAVGTVATLTEYSHRRGQSFRVEVVDAVLWEGERVSSSRLRTLVAAGQVEQARSLLGRPYALQGPVEPGQGIGKNLLGIPTANVRVEAKKLLPADGVYAVRVRYDGQEWPGALNIGLRPTIGGQERTVEVHIIGFSGDLIGRELWLHLEKRLRPEQQFPDLEALRRQISEDIARVREGVL